MKVIFLDVHKKFPFKRVKIKSLIYLMDTTIFGPGATQIGLTITLAPDPN